MLAVTGQAQAEWVDLGPDATGLRVLESDGSRTVVEFTLDGYNTSAIDIDGTSHATYMIPGHTVHMEQGRPQLPTVRQSLILPDDKAVEARVLEYVTTQVSTSRVAPSKGHLKRNVNPASVPFTFDAVYDGVALFPASPIALGEPYIFRDFRGAVLEVNPMRFDPVSSTLEVATKMVIEIVTVEGEVKNGIERATMPTEVDPEFYPLYQTHFVNFDYQRYSPIDEPGRCVIYSEQSLWPAAQELYEWKLQKGIPTMLLDVDDYGSDADLMKAQMDDLLSSEEGLTYVILVGDVQQVPTMYGELENAPSDVTYSRLIGTDFYPDILISRISVQTLANAEYVVHKMIRYERDPDMGDTDWYHKATGVASSEGGWSGYTDCERVVLVEDMLLDFTYTQADRICEPTATKAMVFSALNAGSSIVNYIGHGSGTSWGTTGFNVNDIHNLDNGWRSNFLVDVACTNGQYTMNESFSEAWVRAGSMADPKAGIGTYGSSLVCSWIPPCIMQNEANRLLTQEITTTTGGMCLGGMMLVLDTEGTEGIILFEEYNILGDCSVRMRTDVPALMDVTFNPEMEVDATNYEVTVAGSKDILVSLYADGVLYGSEYTDDTGYANIELDVVPTEPMELTLTVSGFNKETQVHTIVVDYGSLAEMLIENVDISDFGDGTINGQIEAGETADLLLTLRNDGLETAANVAGQLIPITEGVSVSSDMANYGSVDPGNTAVGDQPYTISVDSSIADGTILVFSLDIVADAGSWDDGMNVTAHAPIITVKWIHMDDSTGDGNGRLDPNESGQMLLQVENTGSGDAAGVSANVVSGAPVIQVVPGAGTLASLPSGAEGVLDPRFAVTALPSAGQRYYNMNLIIGANNGHSAVDPFQLPVGGFYDNVENGEGGFTHEMAQESFVDDWHLSDDRNATPPGSSAWKSGGEERATYSAYSDGVLLTPEIGVGSRATLRFNHWIDAELSGQEGYARDGGFVEISINGGAWELLEPNGGYPYLIEVVDGGAPLPADTPVFSGASGWTEEVFSLDAVAGVVQFRFHFGSDGSNEMEGWYIDDVSVMGTEDPTSVELPLLPANELYLANAAPNPVHGATTIAFQLPSEGKIDLGIYDAHGRRVATLAQGSMDAGIHMVDWNGSSDNGIEVASGVYFAKLAATDGVVSRRVIVVK